MLFCLEDSRAPRTIHTLGDIESLARHIIGNLCDFDSLARCIVVSFSTKAQA